MTVVAVMYPGAGTSKFDLDYYMAHHIPLVRRLWSSMGLSDIQVLRGTDGPDGTPPTYTAVALLTFSSMDAFGAAAEAHGKEIFADIPHFTDAKPVIQFNEAV